MAVNISKLKKIIWKHLSHAMILHCKKFRYNNTYNQKKY